MPQRPFHTPKVKKVWQQIFPFENSSLEKTGFLLWLIQSFRFLTGFFLHFGSQVIKSRQKSLKISLPNQTIITRVVKSCPYMNENEINLDPLKALKGGNFFNVLFFVNTFHCVSIWPVGQLIHGFIVVIEPGIQFFHVC